MKEYADTSIQDAGTLALATAFPVLASIPLIVTPNKLEQLRSRRPVFIVGGIMALVLVLILFHFLVMDLGIFGARLARWIGI
jgi:polysaccharide biosynthesis transport protein